MAQRRQRGWLKKEKRCHGETWIFYFRTIRKSDAKRVGKSTWEALRSSLAFSRAAVRSASRPCELLRDSKRSLRSRRQPPNMAINAIESARMIRNCTIGNRSSEFDESYPTCGRHVPPSSFRHKMPSEVSAKGAGSDGTQNRRLLHARN